MKVIIFGATGTGKTTLGGSLAERLGCVFLDADDYYWEKTDPPFEEKIPLAIRNSKLQSDFVQYTEVVISGSLGTWSSYWDSAFDFGVHLVVPKEVRMRRLARREIDRYGNLLLQDEAIKKKSDEFLEWAEGYETNHPPAHGYKRDQLWIEKLSCPVVELNGDYPTAELIDKILEEVKNLKINR